jgi:hypothetical protein
MTRNAKAAPPAPDKTSGTEPPGASPSANGQQNPAEPPMGPGGLQAAGAATPAPGTAPAGATSAAPDDDDDAGGPGQKKGGRRSKTIARREMLRDRKNYVVDPELMQVLEETRPRFRRDCINGVRPCPYVSCKHHLYLDVNPQTGSIKLNFPDKEVWELEETCALDVADRGGITLEEVGAILNLTRERIRQVEVTGLRKIQVQTGITDLDRLLDE